jgi:predicted dehydrogenase
MKTIRLGLVGYGFRGPGLLGMARSVEALTPAAVCAVSPATGQKVRTDFPEVAFFTDYDEMLQSGTIDAVLIETPPMTHAPFALAALRRNIHVLSDVPAVHTLEEARPLWDAAQSSRAIYMFGGTANYFGFIQTCRDLIERGLLGKPFYLEADYVHDIAEFAKLTPWRQGYEPIRYCTHSLGPLLRWLGEELVAVSCFDTGSHVEPGTGGHDAMVAIFRTPSNAVVKLLLSFTNSNPQGVHRYLCHGTRGSVECTWPLTGEPPRLLFATREVYGLTKPVELPVSSQRPELSSLKNLSGHGPLDYAMLQDFVATVRGGSGPLDLKEGLKMTLPGLFALESARRGGALVEITYPWSGSPPPRTRAAV